jgi:uncharacterized membrane protein
MKRLFWTGLMTLLPFTLTLLIVLFVINILTDPFQNSVESILDYYDLLDQPFWFLSKESVLYISSKVLVIVSLFIITILIGLLAHLVITKFIFQLGNDLIARIPVINRLYQSVHDIVEILFKSNNSSFSQVVLVKFPHNGARVIGLVTKKQTPDKHEEEVPVFIPGSPNPTAGFILSYKYNEVIFLDIKVEDGLKFIVSCGTILGTGHE